MISMASISMKYGISSYKQEIMKKILSIFLCIFVILLSIAIFIWLNIGSLWNIYHDLQGDKLYNQEKYQEALVYHDKMIDWDDKFFSLWNDYYRLWEYKNAAQAFSKINGYRWLYNAGNAFFRFWEESSSTDDTIRFWQQSLDFYQQSLNQKETTEAKTNYDRVKQKLDDLLLKQQKEQEEKPEQEEKENTSNEPQESQQQTWDSSQDEVQSQSGEQTDSGKESNGPQQNTSQTRWEQYKLWEWSQVPEITPSEKASLERYIDSLQQEERQNQRYFNKSSKQPSSRDAFDSFFGQFGSFDGWRGVSEKDW